MNLSMLQASNTMGQLHHKLDLIGNNMANTSTPGYKSRQADFASLLSQQINNQSDEEAEVNRLTPNGIRVGSGAKLAHTNIDLTQGSLEETGRGLDIALREDNHLFQLQVETEEGPETQYTRAGNFYLSPMENGQVMLTNSNGRPVLDENEEPLTFIDNMEDISVREDGAIMVTRDGVQEAEGQLGVVEAVRPRMLEAAGENRFRIPEEAAAAADDILVGADAQVASGTLESSNVDLAKQMTDMQNAQRAYEFNSRSISTGDEMMGLVNQLRS
ncbi:flagellar hook-basal body complex protein FlhP [Halobacillus andaensis]|uniref:Flagellar hook-basal body complex protein FlhP n=1 Tax=Halobacillus andaensis TaxID=1176239 RepID=A0A917EVG0_HALAA|nr:flagellar hook-basal body protein [Halobacillus andaensis]MBP2004388.1 flagellar basal-body rod protein FlgG [Halobacillus andaensis]GGF22004.1 flagellar hook-basal body complex protein FlhP [Halobacillus andaensis]